MTRSEKLAFAMGAVGIAATVVVLIAFQQRYMKLDAGHFWTHYSFVNVFSLIALFSFGTSVGVVLRRVIRRRNVEPQKHWERRAEFNLKVGALNFVLWTPVYILWLFFVSDLTYSEAERGSAAAYDALSKLGVFGLPITGVAIALLCGLIDDLFNPAPS